MPSFNNMSFKMYRKPYPKHSIMYRNYVNNFTACNYVKKFGTKHELSCVKLNKRIFHRMYRSSLGN